MDRNIHPSRISEAFKLAVDKAEEILEEVGFPVNLDEREDLIACTKTSLSSKVVHIHSDIFAPLAVDAVLKIADRTKHNVDLDDIRIVKSIGGTIDETAMVDGLVLRNKLRMKGIDIPRVQNAKVCLIQFCVSPPKTDMDNNIVVSDYKAMDR